jgi:hypothetical protein
MNFEVLLGADNRKEAITVARTEGDKFEIKKTTEMAFPARRPLAVASELDS